MERGVRCFQPAADSVTLRQRSALRRRSPRKRSALARCTRSLCKSGIDLATGNKKNLTYPLDRYSLLGITYLAMYLIDKVGFRSRLLPRSSVTAVRRSQKLSDSRVRDPNFNNGLY